MEGRTYHDDMTALVRLALPREVAFDLMADGVVEPYLREDRVDPALITAIVSAGAGAATTVVVTRLTSDAVQRVVDRLRKPRGTTGEIELSVRTDGEGTVTTLKITATTSAAEVMRLLQPRAPDDEQS
jgi:hypothetical protein